MNAHVASPLAGRRVAVTRAPDQAGELLALLRARGAEPLACATIAIEAPADGHRALDDALRALKSYDWVAFTSRNAVAAFADRVEALGISLVPTVRLAAVGAATACAVNDRLRAADFVPSRARGESLATEMSAVAGRRVLFPRGDLASETFGRLLRERGATVDEVVAYRTVSGEGSQELAELVRRREVDAILFMSASSVRNLVDALDADHPATRLASGGPAVVCIGPETALAARERGVEVSAVAAEQTAEGVVEALERWFGREDDGTGR